MVILISNRTAVSKSTCVVAQCRSLFSRPLVEVSEVRDFTGIRVVEAEIIIKVVLHIVESCSFLAGPVPPPPPLDGEHSGRRRSRGT